MYAKHDKIAHTVALRISGTLVRDDVRHIEQRVERFAEENARVAAILISEWNGVTSETVVGMNWDAQCLLRLGAAQEQLGKLTEQYFDFLLRIEPPSSLSTVARSCVSRSKHKTLSVRQIGSLLTQSPRVACLNGPAKKGRASLNRYM